MSYLFPGLPPGYSRGPLGTRIFSLIVVLLLLTLLLLKLGLRSGAASLVADAGKEGLRNCSLLSDTGSVRWNLRRGRDSAGVSVSVHTTGAREQRSSRRLYVGSVHSPPESSGMPFRSRSRYSWARTRGWKRVAMSMAGVVGYGYVNVRPLGGGLVMQLTCGGGLDQNR